MSKAKITTPPSEDFSNVGGYVPPEDGIGDRIRQARESKGYTQEMLRRLTVSCDPEGRGISRSVLAYYEKGKFKPGARELRILYLALGLTPNWLVLGKDDPERLRQFRELLGSEEVFFSSLTENLKKLDSDSLNGIANLVFLAADNLPGFIAQTDKLSKVIDGAVARAESVEARINEMKSKPSKQSKSLLQSDKSK